MSEDYSGDALLRYFGIASRYQDPSIAEFYKVVPGDWLPQLRAQQARELLIRIAANCGFSDGNVDHCLEYGMWKVAQQDTDEAAMALAHFARIHGGWPNGTVPQLLAKMTAPGASKALDKMVEWTRGNSFWAQTAVGCQEQHVKILARRAEPIQWVIVDTRHSAGRSGYRIARSEPAAWSLYGWIRADGSYTLGLDPQVDADGSELVFDTATDAYWYAQHRNWVVLNAGEVR